MDWALIVTGVVALAGVAASIWMALLRGWALAQAAAGEARAGAAQNELASARSAYATALAGHEKTEAELRARADAESEISAQRLAECAQLRERAAALENDLVQAAKAHADRVADIERRHQELGATARDQFKALASELLTSTAGELQRQAAEQFGGHQKTLGLELEQRRAKIEELLTPIRELLTKADTNLGRIERERTVSFATLAEQIAATGRASEVLRTETGKLVNALKKPHVRGAYGEVQLRRVVEIAGMREYAQDFTTQESVRDADGRLLRPDMIVNMPNSRAIVIDAKTNIGAYVEALEADSEAEREVCLERFADHVAEQVGKLSGKAYWDQVSRSPGSSGTPDFVVMFVPADQFLDAALSRRPRLIEQAAECHVILASPSTLIGLLRVVELGWREQRLAKDAEQLFELGKELHERASVAWEYAARLGRSLSQSVEHYNDFVGSVDARLTPTLKRFEAAGAKSSKPLPALPEVTVPTRELKTADEANERMA